MMLSGLPRVRGEWRGVKRRRATRPVRVHPAHVTGRAGAAHRPSCRAWGPPRRPSISNGRHHPNTRAKFVGVAPATVTVNLYGMSLHNQQRGTVSLSYGLPSVRHPSGIDPGVQRPPLRQGQGPPTTSGLFVQQGVPMYPSYQRIVSGTNNPDIRSSVLLRPAAIFGSTFR